MISRLSFRGLPQGLADARLAIVQRLFSMVPAGTAGAALLILRLSVVATFVVDGTAQWALVTSLWITLVLATLSLFICLGIFTPYCSISCCLLQLFLLLATRGENRFQLAVSIGNSGVLAGLGPGAYSIDARIFGRRRLTLPPRG
jgi:uncharacterized membrane protein YphA (DoxX/SURF4 family)